MVAFSDGGSTPPASTNLRAVKHSKEESALRLAGRYLKGGTYAREGWCPPKPDVGVGRRRAVSTTNGILLLLSIPRKNQRYGWRAVI